jgi:hypothetical protein
MHGFWMMVREGGWGAFLALFFGLVGMLVGMGAAVTLIFSRRAAFYVGVFALVTATFAAATGVLGMASGRRTADRAIAAASISHIQRDRIRSEGYKEAAGAARVGFDASMVPLLLGLVAVALGAGAKRVAGGPTYAPPGAFAPPPPKPPSSAGRWVAGGVVAAFALLTSVGALASSKAPLPQGKYAFPEDDVDAWDLAEARETYDTDHERGCDDMDQALQPFWVPPDRRQWPRVFARDPSAVVPDWSTVATACAETLTTEMRTGKITFTHPGSPDGRRGPKTWDPEALLESPLLVDPRIHAELVAATTGPGLGLRLPGSYGSDASVTGLAGIGLGSADAGASLGTPTTSGRLAKEVIRRVVRRNMGQVKYCYESGLTKNPSLAGTVKVRFTIGTDGTVSSTRDAGSSLPDADVKACVLRAFSRMTFPQPQGGVVEVTYPVVLKPAG